MAGFDQALKYLKDHREEQVSIRLPHWKQDVDIRLHTAQDDRETRAAGQPTHDYLTAASRHGFIPWIPTQIELLSDDWQLCDATGKVID